MDPDILHDTIDQIYEASVVPEHWPNVLKRLADVSHCRDGMLVINPTTDGRWIASQGLVEAMTEFTRDGWASRNSKAQRLAPIRHPGFVRDLDIYAPEEIEKDPVISGLLGRHGFWYSTGTMIYVPTGDLVVFDIERAYGEPPVEPEAVARLDRLRPHLARAALISARLGLERARAMVESLELIGLPAAAFGRAGRVLAVNPLLEALDQQFIARARDRLAIAEPPANSLLTQALERADAGLWSGVMSIPVPAKNDQAALIAHLVPVKRAAHDIFTGARSVLVVTPLAAPQAPSGELLNGLFDLTPAEARVARAIVQGGTIDSVATQTGVSRETVRNQLKAVLTKTGTARQAELVGLLVGKAMPFHG